jgi:branched-chain amino acid transport system permease protein
VIDLLRLVIAGVMIGSIYSLIGLGFSLTYSGTGLINWAQGELYMIGAFLAWTLLSLFGLPFIIALPVALAILFALGAGTYLGPVRFVTNRGGRFVEILLLTIGLSFLLRNGAEVIWGSTILTVPNIIPGMFTFGSAAFPRLYVVVLGVAVIAVISLFLFLSRTGFGTAMRASADNPYAAVIVGVPVRKVNAVSWGIAAAVAGLAGFLISPLFGALSIMGLFAGLKGFVAAVVGGFGNPRGALLGGLLLGVTETLVTAYVSSQLKDVVAMILLIIFLVLRPQGLLKSTAVAA